MIAAIVVARRLESDLTAALGRFPVITLLGPRQVGKTTLALKITRAWPTRVDTGLLHALLGIPDWNALQGHPVVSFSWEGFAIEHVLATRPDADVSF